MKRTFFENVKTLDELKKQYKKLCKQYHPDNGGDAETMKAVNAEYDEVFARVKNIRETADGRTYTAAESTTEKPEEFMNIINRIIGLDGIIIELIGTWIWVTGDTYKCKESLKAAGFKWCGKKKAWSWHRPEDAKISKKKFTLDEIRSKFGSEEIKTQGRIRIAAC
jgi:hypothetical protein